MKKRKQRKYVVLLSGGKDSTAMLLRLIEEKRPIDLILFCDTGLEFPQMYEHLKQVEEYIGMPIVILKAPHSFEYYLAEYNPKRKNPQLLQYRGNSWAGPKNRWCTAMLKIRITKAYLREMRNQYEVIEYVGIAADESRRVRERCYPLVEWGMTEADCLAYCYERGFYWGGLYELFSRVSCWCCPLQSLNELRKLYEHFPNLWCQLQKWDDMTWRQFRADFSVRELTIRFEMEKEWMQNGQSIKSKAFHQALRERLKKAKEEVCEDKNT